jgi:hypothetical protein
MISFIQTILSSLQKPFSGKARKAQLQHKRAQKQANATPVPFPADAANPSSSTTKDIKIVSGRNAQTKTAFRTTEQRARDEMHGSRMALESRFIRLPKEVQDINRNKAATEILERPIEEEMGVLRVEELQPAGGEELICPKRPKWSYNSTKKEVEKNEGELAFILFCTCAVELIICHCRGHVQEMDG